MIKSIRRNNTVAETYEEQRELAYRALVEVGKTPDVAEEMLLSADIHRLGDTNPEVADRVTSIIAAGAGEDPATFRHQISRLLHPATHDETADADMVTALENVSEFIRAHDRVPQMYLAA